eukprot:CAMPEP_0113632130 /NCGR_PEP_ID=MMETSP0017_2-20120614/16697_1 /TAXON_ID=2856 /ORGANISM="Cylindrotheca closterium" /LENGTH=239 /DNA_ID=CAMNT_0000542667 /DNA_START=62 /DNA_END=778 /DNA_ORIENTATION=+ /assembly_acc=CAM_ASM_000147
MAPFRRPGLEDDEAESRPDTLRPRPPPSFRGPPAYSSTHQVPSHSYAGDEDSVVSGLSAMSDLESLYLESSSNNRPKDARDQYLLAQRLPGQATNDSSSGNERSGPTNLLNGFIDENDDEEDKWEDMVYAATLQQSRQSQVAPKPQQTIDPAEQERLDLNRAIAESRLQHEKEQMHLAQIIEDDEESPQKEKKSKWSSSKKSKKRDKKSEKLVKQKSRSKSPTNGQDVAEKPKKKGGMW